MHMVRNEAIQRAKSRLSAAFIACANGLQAGAGMTNMDISRASGISPVTVSRLMNGRFGTTSVTWDTLEGLAKAFGIQSWDELLGAPPTKEQLPE